MTAKMTEPDPATCASAGLSTATADRSAGSAPGRVIFRAPLVLAGMSEPCRVDPMTLGIIADVAVGAAVISARPAPAAGVMAELCIDHVGTPGAGARALEIMAQALETGPDTGTGRATIQDDTGIVVAHVMGVLALDPGGGPVPERPRPRSFDPPDTRLVPLDSDAVRVEIQPDMLNHRGTVDRKSVV